MNASALTLVGYYWHTLRHLRPVQFIGRLRFRLVRSKPDLSDAPPVRAISGPWQRPASRAPSLTGPGEMMLLGEQGSLEAHGWDSTEKSALWRYNLHYFDDLNAEDAEARRGWQDDLIRRWIEGNAPGEGPGWEPYPTSLRIVNWVKSALSGHALPEGADYSLAVQARWLTRRLEWHLLGNHLFANAKALMFAGLYFDGPEAARWRSIACDILECEIPEQILPDGGQFELSPMYHALALEDVLDLLNLLTACRGTLSSREAALATQCAKVAPGMAEWLQAMSHPDGRISFFNDAAFGIAPENADLLSLAERLGLPAPAASEPLHYLPHSGYARLSAGPAVLICDMAAVGPDYLPGHAHADTLSCELSLFGQRVLVNSGTSEYGLGPERLRQRGTPAHSTVTVAGEDSSEVWSGFRVARRARVDAISVVGRTGALSVSARHNGYTRFAGGPYHCRDWTLTDTGLMITDTLEPAQEGEARYHLPPEVYAETTAPNAGVLRLSSGRVLHWRANGARARLEPTTWHPHFGSTLPCQCLSLTFFGTATFDLDWT